MKIIANSKIPQILYIPTLRLGLGSGILMAPATELKHPISPLTVPMSITPTKLLRCGLLPSVQNLLDTGKGVFPSILTG